MQKISCCNLQFAYINFVIVTQGFSAMFFMTNNITCALQCRNGIFSLNCTELAPKCLITNDWRSVLFLFFCLVLFFKKEKRLSRCIFLFFTLLNDLSQGCMALLSSPFTNHIHLNDGLCHSINSVTHEFIEYTFLCPVDISI